MGTRAIKGESTQNREISVESYFSHKPPLGLYVDCLIFLCVSVLNCFFKRSDVITPSLTGCSESHMKALGTLSFVPVSPSYLSNTTKPSLEGSFLGHSLVSFRAWAVWASVSLCVGLWESSLAATPVWVWHPGTPSQTLNPEPLSQNSLPQWLDPWRGFDDGPTLLCLFPALMRCTEAKSPRLEVLKSQGEESQGLWYREESGRESRNWLLEPQRGGSSDTVKEE